MLYYTNSTCLAYRLRCKEEGRNPDGVNLIVGFQVIREVQEIWEVWEVQMVQES